MKLGISIVTQSMLLLVATAIFTARGRAADEPASPNAGEIARIALDEQTEGPRREAILRDNVKQAAEVVAAMTADLPDDAAEEYRRIPWIWRMAIAAGRANDSEVLQRLLDVSLPKDGQPLRDWQAVVIGGGIINGLTQVDVWPRLRIGELLKEADSKARWERTIALAAKMADNEKVPSGTRYDALRILGADRWEKHGKQLVRYLAKDAHPELQMGAVSGAGDIDEPGAASALLSALAGLTEGNRKLAIDALLRSRARRDLLRDAVAAGTVEQEWLDDAQRERLKS